MRDERAPSATRASAGGPVGVDMRSGDLRAWLAQAFACFADRPAMESGGRRLTYAQLHAASSQLADALSPTPSGERVVAAVLARDPVAILVALLAAIQADAVYVPLDPSAPPARLEAIASELVPDVVVAGPECAQLAGAVSPSGGPPRLLLTLGVGSDGGVSVQRTPGPGPSPARGDALPPAASYIFYTSGSTGTPKGIVGHLPALSHFIRWEVETLGVSDGARASQFVVPSFDAYLRDVLVPLCVGGTICVPPAPVREMGPDGLAAWLDSERIGLVHCVPSVFRALLHAGLAPTMFGALRHVLMAGEALKVEDVRRWMNVFGERVHLVNLYGSTETTMVKFFHPVTRADLARDSIPIGRPMEGAAALVVDERGRPCPPRVAGEILIFSQHLTLGYFNNEALTAAAFVQYPFDAPPGKRTFRVYRTGDYGVVLEDGTYLFQGRRDNLVKLRGVRVELGEVEAALAQHPDVGDNVVLAREDSPGDMRLVAYVVPRAGRSPAVDALRAHVAARLPEYMVPSALVLLTALPLTPNGKVDRMALPAPDGGSAGGALFVEPRSPAERAVAAVFEEVLRLERVSAEGRFFDLGGHSLLAMQVVSRLRRELGVEIPLRALFEAPSVAQLAARVDSARAQPDLAAAPALEKADRSGKPLSLSFAQERLWFLDQLEPGSTAYHIPGAVRLRGALDVPSLSRALDEVVARHEPLRTTFPVVAGAPAQIVAPVMRVGLSVGDLSALPLAEREHAAARLLADVAQAPFDLGRGPLVRAALAKLSEGQHVLAFCMHHVVSDGWSMGVLVREIAALYDAFSRGEPSPLAPLAIQYADYAAWQRAWLSGKALETQLAYWKGHLAGAPALLELPTDRPRPAVIGYQGARAPVALSREASEALSALARAEGATPFMALLAAFSVLLSRYSRQQDVVIGAPIAGRTRQETEALIGLFVNTLALRVDLSGDPSFRRLLARARESTLGAYAHQDVPFEKVVAEIGVPRSMAHSPVFQAVLDLQNAPFEALSLPGLALEPIASEIVTAKFDLVLHATETPGGLRGAFEYRTDLFDAATMARMAGHLATLVDSALARPDAPASSLPLMGEAERRRMLVEWNDTAAPSAGDVCLHELFEVQADKTPGALAIIAADARLTYAEVEARSNRLAHALRHAGARVNTLVAVVMRRGWAQLVAVLAVHKAGAAYLPVSPDLPSARVRYLLEDGGAAIALTASDFEGPEVPGVRFLVADDASRAESPLAARPARAQCAGDLAYVIYTSGSTGNPKGVMIDHRGAVNTVLDVNARFSIGTRDRVLGVSALNFDLSVYDIFGTLAAGGAVVLPEPSEHPDPVRWLEWVSRERVTVWDSVPALMELFVSQLPPGTQLPDLRVVMLSGDWLPVSLPDRVRAVAPNTSVTSLGGATEASIWSILHPIGRVDPEWRSIPYGRPMVNQRFHVLNESFEPCPVGVAGELFIAGVGVALGYWNNAERTAQSFVPDPFAPEPGARMYRTGDFGRYLCDGDIEFLGRRDAQVKVRGFRIELGEIEAVLAAHPAVKDVAVLARDGAGPSDKRLVAYVVAREGVDADADALRSHLRARLPEYMVPAAFVALGALPLSANGKVDRKALPAPEAGAMGREVYIAPRTTTAEAIAAIFAQVLGLQRVSADGHFFELGGHSLLATQVASRVRALGAELPLRAVFEAPTVAQLAARVDAVRAGEGASTAPVLAPAARGDGPLPLSFAQERLWFLDQLEPGSIAYHIPGAIRLRGALDVPALSRALDDVVARHEALRTGFEVLDGAPTQRVAPASHLDLPVTDLSALPEGERGGAALAVVGSVARAPFDLSRGPLVRAALARIGNEEHVLAFCMHHVVSDGWSMGVLVREIAALYDAFSRGEPSSLAPLAIQYADYAAWQRAWLSGKALETQLAYWKGHLAGAPALLELPTDRPRPAVIGYQGARAPVALSREASEALSALARAEGATPFMALLAAFSVLLSRYSRQQDVVIGAPIAGRTRQETEALIGLFVNTLALRVDLSGDPSFRRLLARARESTLGAYAHQDVPFEKVVAEIGVPRSMAHSPVFQAMLSLQNAPFEALSLPGLALEPLAGEGVVAKFDLTLTLTETPEGLRGSFEYAADLFDAATIERMAGHLVAVVERAAARPDAPAASLPMMREAERERVLRAWNDVAVAYPTTTVHEAFAAQAARAPDAVAVVAGEARVTFGELAARAGALAGELRALGVGRGSLVGVCLGRSAELAVALLGVLGAGGAYVPMDPALPAERLAYMLEDSGALVVLADGPSVPSVPAGAHVVRVDGPRGAGEGFASGEGAEGGAGPWDLAYVMYTSGSTGRPKGVAVTHGGLSNFLASMRAEPGLEARDVLVSVTTPSFDIFGLELYLPLLVGARVVMASREVAADGARLAALLADAGAIVMQATPATWRLLLESGWAGSPSLTALCGGEALAPELAARLTERCAALWNLYGPTETTIWSSVVRISVGERVTLGRPIANTQLYVLDERGEPAPLGVPGELLIGGDGVARGYWNRPELTAERFVPDPYSSEPGARMYKTGDLARRRADGALEYLGRLDFQVKLRGFRIELGEIESALARHPAVGACVVAARADGAGGEARLVAYLVAREGQDAAPESLRVHLRASLPEYMVPSAFVALPALPLNTSGKVDRKALPAPEAPAGGAAYVAPRTPTEDHLARIFAEILRVDRVGAEDNFFALGGHSLLATRVVAAVRRDLGVELPLRALFEASTVTGLAVRILEARATGVGGDELEAALADLEGLSDEEAERLLSEDLNDQTKGRDHKDE